MQRHVRFSVRMVKRSRVHTADVRHRSWSNLSQINSSLSKPQNEQLISFSIPPEVMRKLI